MIKKIHYPVDEVPPVNTNITLVSDEGEVDPCGVLVSQPVLKTTLHKPQLNPPSLIVKDTLVDSKDDTVDMPSIN